MELHYTVDRGSWENDMMAGKMSPERLRRAGKHVLWAIIVYWGIRAPCLYVMVEWFGMHYITAGFVLGVVLTIVGFFVGELWIWKDKIET